MEVEAGVETIPRYAAPTRRVVGVDGPGGETGGESDAGKELGEGGREAIVVVAAVVTVLVAVLVAIVAVVVVFVVNGGGGGVLEVAPRSSSWVVDGVVEGISRSSS